MSPLELIQFVSALASLISSNLHEIPIFYNATTITSMKDDGTVRIIVITGDGNKYDLHVQEHQEEANELGRV